MVHSVPHHVQHTRHKGRIHQMSLPVNGWYMFLFVESVYRRKIVKRHPLPTRQRTPEHFSIYHHPWIATGFMGCLPFGIYNRRIAKCIAPFEIPTCNRSVIVFSQKSAESGLASRKLTLMSATWPVPPSSPSPLATCSHGSQTEHHVISWRPWNNIFTVIRKTRHIRTPHFTSAMIPARSRVRR